MGRFTLLFFLLSGLIACSNAPENGFELSPAELLAEIEECCHELSPEEVNSIISGDNNEYKLVDLRSPAAFNKGHLGGALNVPIQFMMDEENMNLFANTAFTYVLYGWDEQDANAPWMFLRQLGYENVRVLQGGYSFFSTESDSTYYPPETPRYNFVEIFEQAARADSLAVAANKPKPQQAAPKPQPKKVVPVKKKTPPPVFEEEEGC